MHNSASDLARLAVEMKNMVMDATLTDADSRVSDLGDKFLKMLVHNNSEELRLATEENPPEQWRFSKTILSGQWRTN